VRRQWPYPAIRRAQDRSGSRPSAPYLWEKKNWRRGRSPRSEKLYAPVLISPHSRCAARSRSHVFLGTSPG